MLCHIMKVRNYKLIVETIQDGVFIISDGIIQYANDALSKMTGYTCDEIMKCSYPTLIYEDDVTFVEEMYKKRLDGEDVPREYEFRLKHKDGSIVYVIVSVGVINFDKKPAVTGTVKNITDRIQSELKIKEIEHSYHMVLELCPDPIIISDFEGTILMHNQAAYDANEPTSTNFKLQGTNVLDSMATNEDKSLVAKLIPVDEDIVKYNVNLKTQKGRIVPFELHTTTAYDSNGNPTCKITIGRDISQIKKYEKNLKQLIYEKELMIREVHHRIKNNLQQIYSLLGLQIDDEYLMHAIGQSKDGGEECNIIIRRIINDARRRILAISTIHRMFYKDNLSCVDFATFIEELSENIGYTYDSLDKDIKVSVDGNSFELCLDYIIPCGLIINEILINSYKYAFKDTTSGQIKIHLEREDALRTIILTDNGSGMTTGDSEGKTLGLALIRGLTEQINGTLEIESAPTKGTMYKIIFKDIKFNGKK